MLFSNTILAILDKITYMKLRTNALVIARFRVQYGKYFPSFSYFVNFFKVAAKHRK